MESGTRCTLPGYTSADTLPSVYPSLYCPCWSSQEALPPWEGLQSWSRLPPRPVLFVLVSGSRPRLRLDLFNRSRQLTKGNPLVW